MPNLTFCGGRDHKTMTFFFFSSTSIQSFRIKLQKKLPTFDELNEMERDKVRSSATSLFSDVFVSVAVVVALSPSIHIQILQTDLPTFPLRISWEILIKHRGVFSFVIIFYILTTLSLDNVWTSLGENCCWSLLELKGLSVLLTVP